MVNKKALIELFEDKIANKRPSHIYIKETSCDSYGFEFYIDEEPDIEEPKIYESDNYYNSKKSNNQHCKLYLLQKNLGFFICFNSIKTEITQEEFKNLHEKINARIKFINETYDNYKKEYDLKMLDLVFSEKNKKESRQTLIEKQATEKEIIVLKELKNP